MEVNQPEQMEAKGVNEEDWEDSGFQHSLRHCTDGQLHGSWGQMFYWACPLQMKSHVVMVVSV